MNPGTSRPKIGPVTSIPKLLLMFALGGGIGFAAQNQAQGGTAAIPPVGANAQSTEDIVAVPDRPTFSNTAETVQTGVFEIEYGFELAHGHQNINGLLKFGLLKNLEIRFANNPCTRDGGIPGIGDSGAGFKFRFLEGKRSLPTMSVLYAWMIPTATTGPRTSGHFTGLLLSKDFGRHHLDFNEGIQWLSRDAGGFDHNYFTAIAYSHPITQKLGYSEELASFSHTSTAAATFTVMQSLTYVVYPRLMLDAGVYVAAKGDLPRATFFAGITYAVGDLYRRHKSPNH